MSDDSPFTATTLKICADFIGTKNPCRGCPIKRECDRVGASPITEPRHRRLIDEMNAAAAKTRGESS